MKYFLIKGITIGVLLISVFSLSYKPAYCEDEPNFPGLVYVNDVYLLSLDEYHRIRDSKEVKYVGLQIRLNTSGFDITDNGGSDVTVKFKWSYRKQKDRLIELAQAGKRIVIQLWFGPSGIFNWSYCGYPNIAMQKEVQDYLFTAIDGVINEIGPQYIYGIHLLEEDGHFCVDIDQPGDWHQNRSGVVSGTEDGNAYTNYTNLKALYGDYSDWCHRVPNVAQYEEQCYQDTGLRMSELSGYNASYPMLNRWMARNLWAGAHKAFLTHIKERYPEIKRFVWGNTATVYNGSDYQPLLGLVQGIFLDSYKDWTILHPMYRGFEVMAPGVERITLLAGGDAKAKTSDSIMMYLNGLNTGNGFFYDSYRDEDSWAVNKTIWSEISKLPKLERSTGKVLIITSNGDNGYSTDRKMLKFFEFPSRVELRDMPPRSQNFDYSRYKMIVLHMAYSKRNDLEKYQSYGPDDLSLKQWVADGGLLVLTAPEYTTNPQDFFIVRDNIALLKASFYPEQPLTVDSYVTYSCSAEIAAKYNIKQSYQLVATCRKLAWGDGVKHEDFPVGGVMEYGKGRILILPIYHSGVLLDSNTSNADRERIMKEMRLFLADIVRGVAGFHDPSGELEEEICDEGQDFGISWESQDGTVEVNLDNECEIKHNGNNILTFDNPSLNKIIIEPGSASLLAGGYQQFTAKCKDQYGRSFSANVTWSVNGGTVSSSGFYTAPVSKGKYTITASSGNIRETVYVTVDDLMAYWSFNEGIGYTAGNSAGDGNQLVLDGPDWCDGRIGYGLKFNGDYDYAVAKYTNSFNLYNTSFTISFWMNPEQYGDPHSNCGNWRTGILWRMQGSLGYKLTMERIIGEEGGILRFIYSGAGPFEASYKFSASQLNQWHFITVVYDKQTGQGRLYINGTLAYTDSSISSLSSVTGSVYIGGPYPDGGATNGYFKGKLDDIRIYCTALNASEIMELMNFNNHPPVANNQPVTTNQNVSKVITMQAIDSDGDSLTYSIVDEPAHGSPLTISQQNQVTYTPNADYSGTDEFTFKANDRTCDSNIAKVSIQIIKDNTAPVISDIPDMEMEVGVANSIDLDDYVEDADNLDSEITWSRVISNSNATVDINSATHIVTITALNGDGCEVTFTATDPEGLSDSDTITVSIVGGSSAPANHPPVAKDQGVTVYAGDAVEIFLEADDEDDGDTLSYRIVGRPSKGSLSDISGNRVLYIHDGSSQGTDEFYFVANDGKEDSGSAKVTVTIETSGSGIGSTNEAPVAYGQEVTTAKDTEVLIVLAARDADGNTLTYTITQDPGHGTVVPTPGNVTGDKYIYKVTYTPQAGYAGEDSFKFKANDGQADSNIAEVKIAVEAPIPPPPAPNHPPVAVGCEAETTKDTAVRISLGAIDPDGDRLTCEKVREPEHGEVVISPSPYTGPNSDPFIAIYTPETGYVGPDSFTFKVKDGELYSNEAVVTITVNAPVPPPPAPENHPPVAYPQEVTVTNGTTLLITLRAYDQDGDTLTYTITQDPGHGTVVPTPGNVTGDKYIYKVTYTPQAGYVGEDSFKFKANDGEADSNIAEVRITVQAPIPPPPAPNHPPVAVGGAVETAKDTSVRISLGATDPDGDRLTCEKVREPEHGEVVISPSPYTGPNNSPFVALYTPDSGYVGTDSFTFKVKDGELYSNEAEVTITVNAPVPPPPAPENHPPVAVGQEAETTKDTPVRIQLRADDPDGDQMTCEIVKEPDHGEVSVDPSPYVGPDDSSFIATYTPDTGYVGEDNFTFKANDGQADSNIAEVRITVQAPIPPPPAPNHPPVAARIRDITTTINTPVQIELVATDEDGDNLTYEIVKQPNKGVVERVSGDGRIVRYTPKANYIGMDNFKFKANDGTEDSNIANVKIRVVPKPVTSTVNIAAIEINGDETPSDDQRDKKSRPSESKNNRPIANGQVIRMEKDSSVEITLKARDLDGDELSYSIVKDPLHGTLSEIIGNSLTYTPEEGYIGEDFFGFKANDGEMNSKEAIVLIRVVSTNSPPEAQRQEVETDKNTPIIITLEAEDGDDDTLSYEIISKPRHGALSDVVDNEVTYTPLADYTGEDAFTFKAYDGESKSNPAVVRINVISGAPLNNPPREKREK